MSDCTRCFASKARGTIIDTLHPETGRTFYYDKTLEMCREQYPDAEEMSIDEFCAWKAEQQHTPITWEETTAETFNDMLNVLPPAAMLRGGFLLGEPHDHDAATGEPRFTAFRKRGGRYEVSCRPMTVDEFSAIQR